MKRSDLIYYNGTSIFSYPFKIIYRECAIGDERVIISVPKKMHKRAVKRNLLKRRIREALRLECKESNILKGKDVMIIYVSSAILDYGKISNTLSSILEKLNGY